MNSLQQLVNKLNPLCKITLENAASICLQKQHYNIELEHWLLALLEEKNSTFGQMLDTAKCSSEQLYYDINKSLQSFQTGNEQTPAISPRVIDLLNEAWLMTSLEDNQIDIDSGILLRAIAKNTALNQMTQGISGEFDKLNHINMHELHKTSSNKSQENKQQVEQTGEQAATLNNTSALNRYAINLNQQAKDGNIDEVIGREMEIYQTIDILARRRQNNTILVGEPGVGKTAIVEGLALRIVQGDVPKLLKNIQIYSLDMGLLQAGASVKGEFEKRLKAVIKEVKSSPNPIIIFIDEAHTLIGAGNSAGQSDAANLLKPALARGELRSIAATTWQEYKKYFEKDAALTRRFQVVRVDEPNLTTATHMLRSLKDKLELHHKVIILEDALQQACQLSQRYMTSRQLPDKAISVLDTACARVASKQHTTPASIEILNKNIGQLTIQHKNLLQEQQQGLNHHTLLSVLEKDIKQQKKQLKNLQKRWQEEKRLTDELTDLMRITDANHKIKKADANKLNQVKNKLAILQGENPLVLPYVDQHAIANVIADWTGIPVGKMLKTEAEQLLNLTSILGQRIIGQKPGLKTIADTITTSQVKLSDPNKPIAIFLLAGPSGIGKTETALALAESLYGSEQNMTTINMSEFKEEHKISMLAGAPPGYVGYGEGGVLTEAVRRKPYSLLLLDEMEKAHPSIQEVFYQVFDKGVLKDGQGQDINFKNTVIFMTTNAGTRTIEQLCADPNKLPSSKTLEKALFNELLTFFKPAFLGRITIIPYLPLNNEQLLEIIQLKLEIITTRFYQHHNIKLIFGNKLIQHILQLCQQQTIGARQIEHVINHNILPKLSKVVLTNLIDKNLLSQIQIDINKSNKLTYKTKNIPPNN